MRDDFLRHARYNRTVARPKSTVRLIELAHALDIAPSKLIALADAGYLNVYRPKKRDPNSPRYSPTLTAKANPETLLRVIDRGSIVLWLSSLDRTLPTPGFDVHVEKEIMRIAKLEEPFRTEQALRMVLRWSDAEKVVTAIRLAKEPDVEFLWAQIRATRLRMRLNALAALDHDKRSRGGKQAHANRRKWKAYRTAVEEAEKKKSQAQNQARSQSQSHPASVQSLQVSPAESARTLPRLASGSETRPPQHPVRH